MMSQNAAVDVEVACVVTRALIGSGQWDKAVQLIQILQARGEGGGGAGSRQREGMVGQQGTRVAPRQQTVRRLQEDCHHQTFCLQAPAIAASPPPPSPVT